MKQTLFERAFGQAASGMALVTGDGEFLRANGTFCSLLGYPEEALLGRSESAFTCPGEPGAAGILRDAAAGALALPYGIVKGYVHRSGREIRFSTRLSLLSEAENNSPCVYLLEAGEAKETSSGTSVKDPACASELYELISGHSRDIIAYGENGILEYVSPASLRLLLGYEPEEILGQRASDFAHPDDLWRLQEEFLGESRLVTCRLRHKKGRYIAFEVAVKRMHSGEDGSYKAVYVGRDMTESERVHQALRNSERRLAQAQQMARIGSWEGDLTAGEVYLSEELLRILEKPPSYRPCFRTLLRLLLREDRRPALGSLRTAFRGEAFHFEGRVRNRDGSLKHIRVQGAAGAGEEGSRIRLQGTVQDVSGQKLMLQMLEESVDRYTSLKHYNLDGILSLNISGMITSANPAAERITGYSTLDMIGLHFTDLLHPSEHQRAEVIFPRILNEVGLEASEIRAVHRSGRGLHLLVTPAPIFVNRRQVGCYILVKDITEQKRKDELLLKSEKLSIAGQLAAGVAHEIRNPLTALKGFVQLMSRGTGSAALYLEIMREELERIESIISELLMLAKPQALQMKDCDLAALVEDVALLLGTQAALQNIEIAIGRPEGDLCIRCDANQIKQVFINLLKNAMEAMPQGGVIRIQVEGAGGEAEERFPVVRITDQGCGIAEEQLQVIGEPFYSTKEAGTGLGLMVSHKIIENHGGRIRISSEMGVGTSIEVSLPAAAG
ncbi:MULTISPECIES: PAS domain-containing protein [Paenibacillus]|uniref:PAS domain-containing protein n=1 Tax=Paenibacillus TaxID=44249 RepID=UPI0022B93FB1|nr:PAS domain S-box protein [Paenibacillus caseinilyticus]MCZ8523816.1 PAS domain S-box protein [Paenibacillus caseinilyticus]